MSMQWIFDITPRQQREEIPIIQALAWHDVTAIARGVGFPTAVQVSNTLNEALQPSLNEVEGDYDQRLYNALWVAHFKLSLDQSQSGTFNFICTRKHCTTGDALEVSLRLRVEAQKQVVQLGLLKDF